MSRIEQIWQQLENQTGAFRRIRYDAGSACDLSLGLRMPEGERLLVLELPFAKAKGIRNRPPSQGIRLEKVANPDNDGQFFLNLVLTDPLFTGVFDVLVDDLVGRLLDIAEPGQVISVFLNQLDQWEALFSRFSANGLTPEQQQGLYGELYVLRILIDGPPGPERAVDGWVGSEAAAQDFRTDGWAIEVKTSSRNTHEQFTVNGERQLDESVTGSLFVYYLNADRGNNGGESLLDIIADIRIRLQTGVSGLISFNRKLVQAGFFDAQAVNYNELRYVIREEYVFRVTDTFPRIVTADLRPGVGDVHYSVSLAGCIPYRITIQELFLNIPN